MYIKISILIQD